MEELELNHPSSLYVKKGGGELGFGAHGSQVGLEIWPSCRGGLYPYWGGITLPYSKTGT